MLNANVKWLRFLDTYVASSTTPTPEALEELNAKVELFRVLERVQMGPNASEILAVASDLAQAIPTIGGILGMFYEGMSVVAKAAEGYRAPSCDSDCHWPISYHRRDIVGVEPSPGSSHVCGGGLYMHLNDGIAVHGLGAGLDKLGRAAGARAWTSKCGSGLGGNARSRAWAASNGDNMSPSQYESRARTARTYVRWMEKKAPCAGLRCTQATLQGLSRFATYLQDHVSTAEELHTADVLRAYLLRMPSRWYASVWYFINDSVALGVSSSVSDATDDTWNTLMRKMKDKAFSLPSTWRPAAVHPTATFVRPLQFTPFTAAQLEALRRSRESGSATQTQTQTQTQSQEQASSSIPRWLVPVGAAAAALGIMALIFKGK